MLESDRNSRCRIKTDLTYKGYSMVVMENSLFRLGILPGKGTDIIELLHKPTDTDFAWFTDLGLRPKSPLFNDYQSQYQGCWQEILPTLSGKHVHKGVPLERYGEVWGVEWEYQIVQNDPEAISVRFDYKLRSMPLRVTKTITMTEGSPGFKVEETVANESRAELHADWGHHITFGTPFLQPGVTLELPSRKFDGYVLPPQGSKSGFDVIDDMEEGRYRLIRQDGIGAEIEWDLSVWPTVWFWRDFGGDTNAPYFGHNYNIGLEIFSSPPSPTLAGNVEAGTAHRFAAYEKRSSSLNFTVIDDTRKPSQ